MTINQAAEKLIGAMQDTSTGELLRLGVMMMEATNSATERRGEEEKVFRALGPLIGAVLSERHRADYLSDNM